MSSLHQDLRFAARGLVKQPGFALTAVLTLALGIGANAAIFSVVDSVLLTPPPFRQPERLVVAFATNPDAEKAFGYQELPLAIGDFYDWLRDSRSFSGLALLQSDGMTMTGQGEPDKLGVVRIAGDFFGVLGTQALLGRTLGPADDTPGKPTAIVLAYDYWRRRFGGDQGVIGRKVLLNGNPVTVAGVMPPRFAFPRGGSEVHASYSFAPQPDAWVPFALTPQAKQDRGSRFSFVVGRLRPGVGIQAAAAELQGMCERFGQLYPDDKGWGVYLTPIVEQVSGGLRPVLVVLWAAVGLVLLIACANVANLLLARAASRQKEIALRTAIGAGRRRLLAQLLTESGLLALLGGVLGTFLAWAGLRTAAAVVPAGTAGAATFALDGRVVLFTAFLCIATTALAGLVPALQMTRPDLAGALREGTRAGAGTMASRRTRSALVVAEIAFAVLLLIAAGLLLRSFLRLVRIDPGFRGGRVLTLRIDLPPEGFSPPQRVAFFNRVAQRLEALPGAAASGMISELPLTGSEQFMSVNFEGRPLPGQGEMWSCGMHSVTPHYHQAMGIPLLRGRYLAAGDVKGAPLVAVIDEAMARAYWPHEDPVGKRFRFGRSAMAPWMTVVGVVGDIRHSSLHADPQPQMYMTVDQAPEPLTPYWVWFVTRTRVDPHALAAAARNAVHEVDRDQPITQVRTMDEVVADSIATRRFSLLLLGLFAALALVLSVVGIYGITSYSVVQRTRELGLRMALGAQPAEVLALVVKEAGALAALGVALGVVAAFAATRTRWMTVLLYKVGATDPLTFAGVALGLALVALVAAYLPGRRATRVSPMVALRTD
jgi:putative ABC transport system permease protein